jgi:endo-1,4-beta-xylanase
LADACPKISANKEMPMKNVCVLPSPLNNSVAVKNTIAKHGLFALFWALFALFFTACNHSTNGEPKQTIDQLDLSGLVAAPVIGAAPDTRFPELGPSSQYTGTIRWKKANGETFTGNFAASAAYKAEITLTAKSGFTFTGIPANAFTYSGPGGAEITHQAGSGNKLVITIAFPEAGVFAAVTDISGLPAAVLVGTPVTLSGTVEPSGASYQHINWTVQSGPAAVNGNTLTASAAGTVILRARIPNGAALGTDFTKDFTITAAASENFVAVTGITGLPETAIVGTPLTLSGTVQPPNASNQTISWTVQSGPATVTGDTLTASAAGTVILRARIPNSTAQGTDFTKDFTITFQETGAFIAVTDISDLPAAVLVGTPLTLSGTVQPSSASNQTINWEVRSGPASVSGNTLTASAAGTVILQARIPNGAAQGTDFTKDFTITFQETGSFVAVTVISGLQPTAIIGMPLTLSGTVEPSNASYQRINWTVQSGPAAVNGNTLTATAAGTVILQARIPNGAALGTDFTKDFTITITASENFVAVTDITGLPGAALAGTPLTLSGTVQPPSASNQTINWEVRSGPATVSGNTLTASAAGTVNLTARIVNGTAPGTDFTRDFTVTVTVPRNDADYTINVSLWVNEDGGGLFSPSGTQTISKAAGQSVTFTVNSGPGWTVIEWYVNGNKTAANRSAFTLKALSYPAGIYQVTVLLYKDGKPWSKSLPVTVTD